MIRRDTRVGRALDRLEVPEHADGFFEVLDDRMRRLDAAEERQAAETHPTGPARLFTLRRVSVAVAGLAVAAAVLAFAGPLADLVPDRVRSPLAPAIATAAEVKAKAGEAVRGAKTLRGTLVLIEAAGDASPKETRWSFATTARGDFRLSGRDASGGGGELTDERAYDATAGVEKGYSVDESGGTIGWIRRDLAAGAPDQSASDLLQRHLGGIVRAMRDVDGGSVRETAHDGRPAWTLSRDVEPNRLADGAPDRVEITVDRETGFPVRVVETARGALVREVRLEDLEVDVPLPAETFEVSIPEDAELYEQDMGFGRGTIDDAAGTVGYEPMLAGWLPDGYSVSEVSFAEEASPTGKEGGNPVSRGVVSVAYRRGFDTLVISTRLVGEDAGAWSDPLSLGEGYVDRPERVTLASGEFASANAELLLDPRGVPHLWALDGELVLTVAGDASRVELLRIAESLAPAKR